MRQRPLHCITHPFPKMTTLPPSDLAALQTAVTLLETPSLTSKLSNLIGQPLESALNKLPAGTHAKIGELVQTALRKAADAALWSLDTQAQGHASNFLHKAMAATSGAVGGAFGFAALAVELPITTTLMLRSIADIARSEGFDLNQVQTKTACIEVFAFGGPSGKDDATESAYYAGRAFMAEAVQVAGKALADAAAQSGKLGLSGVTAGQTGTWMAKFIEYVASRFGIVITEKVAAQAVPLLGAITGATINTMFMDFYQDTAKGHFIVKRLEAQYGQDLVRTAYSDLMLRR